MHPQGESPQALLQRPGHLSLQRAGPKPSSLLPQCEQPYVVVLWTGLQRLPYPERNSHNINAARQKLPQGAIRLPARESTTSASILSASAKPKYCAQLGRPRRAPDPETACAGWHPHRRMQSARVASRPLQASLGKVVRFPSSSRYRVARCRFRQTAAIATPRATVAQQDPQAIDRISERKWRGLGTVPDRKARFRKQRQGQRASPSCHSRWRLVPNEAGPVRKEINAVSGLLEGSTSTGQEGRVEYRAVCPNLLLSFPKGRTSA